MIPRWVYGFFAAVIVIFIAALFWMARPRHHDALRPSTQAAIDSLDRTKPAHDSARAASVKAETASVRAATTAHASAVVTRAGADRVKRERDSLSVVADRLAATARAHDSVDAERYSSWHVAYDAEHAAKAAADRLADSLAAVADSTERAFERERDARVIADARATADSARAERAETTMHAAATDAEHAGDCRWLWVIPCPSRAQAAVAGGVVGVVGGVVGTIVAARRR